MAEKKFLGWLSLGSFVFAMLVLLFIAVLLVFFPTAPFMVQFNAQILFMVAGVLGLIAALLGFFSRQTTQGKIGGIGGLVLTFAIAVLLSFTLTTSVVSSPG